MRRPRPLRCGVGVPYRQLLRPRSVGEAKVARLAKRSASRSASRSRSRDRDRTRDKERSPASEKPRMPVATADADKRRVARSESRSRSRERDRRERDRERDKREKARDRGRDAGAGRSGDADERAPAVEADGSQSASGKRVNREAGASDEEGGTEASRASAKRLKKEKKREARRAEKEKEKAEKEKRARPRSLASYHIFTIDLLSPFRIACCRHGRRRTLLVGYIGGFGLEMRRPVVPCSSAWLRPAEQSVPCHDRCMCRTLRLGWHGARSARRQTHSSGAAGRQKAGATRTGRSASRRAGGRWVGA